jgi:hypothetical protein
MASPSLLDLVHDGTLPVGTELYHHGLRRHAERTVTAVVVADGIEFRGTVYASPSGAARAAADTEANGWQYWRLRNGGQTLSDLRTKR